MAGIDYRALAQMDWEGQPFPTVQYDFRIFFAEPVFDKISLSADPYREVGGILVGNIYTEEGGPFLVVEGLIDALHAREEHTELTITYATWEHVHHEMDTRYVGKRIVGWYHTHPNFGIFLSEQDEFIHKNFFDQPYQIALVYDPVRREHGVFTWRENQPWRMRRYWVGTSEHQWDGTRDGTRPERTTSELAAVGGKMPPPAPEITPQTSRTSLIEDLFSPEGLTLLLLGGLLIVIAGMFGWRGGVSQASEEGRVRGVESAVQSLNADLLDLVEVSLGSESLDSAVNQFRADIEKAVETLQPLAEENEDVQAVINTLSGALDNLETAQLDQQTSRIMLQKLEDASRSLSSQDFREVKTAVAQLYALEAERYIVANNPGFGLELLRLAAALDEPNRAVYENRIREIEEAMSDQSPSEEETTESPDANPTVETTPESDAAPTEDPVPTATEE